MRTFSRLILLALMSAIVSCQTVKIRAPGKPFESTVQAADGVAVAYDVRGRGKTALVFIHGWCSNRTFWREQLDVMAADYRVVAIDLPGHGRSGRDRKDWSFASFAGDVVAVVEALDLERVVLVGHSMGGPVALIAAQRLPDRVIGIVGLDAIGDVEDEDPPEVMERIIAAFEADFPGTLNQFMPRLFAPDTDPELVRWAIESSARADPVMAVAIMQDRPNVDLKELLAASGVPVRCINSATGDPGQSDALVETNRKYADFNAVFVEGVGHFLHLESPGIVNRHLRELVAELMPGGVR